VAALGDDGVHARVELAAGDEVAAHGLARLGVGGELVDPELHARQIAAAAQERVVEIAHELRVVRPLPVYSLLVANEFEIDSTAP
jgi:hypothetical protein